MKAFTVEESIIRIELACGRVFRLRDCGSGVLQLSAVGMADTLSMRPTSPGNVYIGRGDTPTDEEAAPARPHCQYKDYGFQYQGDDMVRVHRCTVCGHEDRQEPDYYVVLPDPRTCPGSKG